MKIKDYEGQHIDENEYNLRIFTNIFTTKKKNRLLQLDFNKTDYTKYKNPIIQFQSSCHKTVYYIESYSKKYKLWTCVYSCILESTFYGPQTVTIPFINIFQGDKVRIRTERTGKIKHLPGYIGLLLIMDKIVC